MFLLAVGTDSTERLRTEQTMEPELHLCVPGFRLQQGWILHAEMRSCNNASCNWTFLTHPCKPLPSPSGPVPCPVQPCCSGGNAPACLVCPRAAASTRCVSQLARKATGTSISKGFGRFAAASYELKNAEIFLPPHDPFPEIGIFEL